MSCVKRFYRYLKGFWNLGVSISSFFVAIFRLCAILGLIETQLSEKYTWFLKHTYSKQQNHFFWIKRFSFAFTNGTYKYVTCVFGHCWKMKPGLSVTATIHARCCWLFKYKILNQTRVNLHRLFPESSSLPFRFHFNLFSKFQFRFQQGFSELPRSSSRSPNIHRAKEKKKKKLVLRLELKLLSDAKTKSPAPPIRRLQKCSAACGMVGRKKRNTSKKKQRRCWWKMGCSRRSCSLASLQNFLS